MLGEWDNIADLGSTDFVVLPGASSVTYSQYGEDVIASVAAARRHLQRLYQWWRVAAHHWAGAGADVLRLSQKLSCVAPYERPRYHRGLFF